MIGGAVVAPLLDIGPDLPVDFGDKGQRFLDGEPLDPGAIDCVRVVSQLGFVGGDVACVKAPSDILVFLIEQQRHAGEGLPRPEPFVFVPQRENWKSSARAEGRLLMMERLIFGFRHTVTHAGSSVALVVGLGPVRGGEGVFEPAEPGGTEPA